MSLFKKVALVLVAGVLVTPACQDNYEYKPEQQIRPGKDQIEQGVFPVVAWTGLDKASDSDEGFIAMRECGINTYLWWYDSMEDLLHVLDNAERDGMKVIARSQELYSDTEAAVRRMMDHPALYGYCIKDEPERNDIGWLSDLVRKIQAIDNVHPCYINIYPNWCWGGVDGYLPIVTDYLRKVPVPLLSFDFYPIMEVDGESQIREGWYANLEDARTASRQAGIPFWAFALTSPGQDGKTVWPVAQLAHLRLQMFSNLVYGAQGFQYFTYHGIVWKGAKLPVYNRVKTVNAELQSLAFIFQGADIKNVWHTGAILPERTRALKAMPYGVESIRSEAPGVIVSQVEKEGHTYIALVNKDYEYDQEVSIVFSRPAIRYDHDGYQLAFEGCLTLSPGDITVFELK